MQSVLAIALLAGLHPCPATTSSPSVPPTPPRLRSGTISLADYPDTARAAGAEGVTRMTLAIGVNGWATECTIDASSGHVELDRISCGLALRRYRFQPATRDGQPVPSTYSMSMTWILPPTPAPAREE